MSDISLIFHHLGLAVENDKQAIIFLRGMGYETGEIIYDPEQNVHLRFCTAPGLPSFELIMPGIGNGPLTPIFKRHNELIYHPCYQVEDLGASLKSIEDAGLRVLTISQPKPSILFGGRRVSFYRIFGFGMIELLER